MSDESVQFTCEQCGKRFEPTPDAMIEWEMGAEMVPASEAEGEITPDELEAAQPWDLKAMGITEEQKGALLRGENIKFGGCICLECQDAMLDEQEPEA